MVDKIHAVLRLGFVGIIRNIYRRYLNKLVLIFSNLNDALPEDLQKNFDLGKLPKFKFDKEVKKYDEGFITIFKNEIQLHKFQTNFIQASSLEIFHIHYLDILNCKKHKLSKCAGLALIDQYLETNADHVKWHPYTQSRQLVNLLKFYRRHEINELPPNHLSHLYRTYRFIRITLETHLMANHYFANLKALFFFDYCYNAKVSKSYRSLIKKLVNEIETQVLPDGGHFELSPTYHVNFMDDMLDILLLLSHQRNFSEKLEITMSQDLSKAVEKCYHWLQWMVGNGASPSFSDTSDILSTPLSIIRDKMTICKLDINYCVPAFHSPTRHFAESGYLVHTSKKYKLVLDCGIIGPKINPGHGHADLGACEINTRDKKFIINGGTACYAGEERMASRSTSNYSTYISESGSSSNLMGDFKVGRAAQVLVSKLTHGISSSTFELLYRSSRRSYKYYSHNRKIELYDNCCTIIDLVDDDCVGRLQFMVSDQFEVSMLSEHEISCYNESVLVATILCSEKIFLSPVKYYSDIQYENFGTLLCVNVLSNKPISTRIHFS